MEHIFKIMFMIGLILLATTGYLAYSTHQFKSEALHADEQITDLHYSRGDNASAGSWFPIVTFTDNTGKQNVFKSSLGGSGYRNSLGEAVDVIYNSGDAGQAQINSNGELYFGSIFCGSFGLILLVIGGVGSRLMSSGSRHMRLMHEGKPLTAKIVDIELNTAININGCSPWRIVCQWLDPQSGQVYLFNSANFYYDPSAYIKDDNITVYVAHNNLKKYYVDTSHLPKKA